MRTFPDGLVFRSRLEPGTRAACLTFSAGVLHLPRTIAVVGLLAVTFVASSGCSGHAPYPKTWPQLRQAPRQPCQRVAGSYWNQGERGQAEHYGPVYLGELLFNKPQNAATATVTLSFPRADQLDVVIAGAETAPLSLSLSGKAGQFKCDGSTLVVKTKTEWVRGVVPPLAPVVGGESIVMKADLIEGYLIVTRRSKDFLWLPIPGWSTWSSWYRFRSVPSDAGGTLAN